ncbi:hypothetical protein IAU59_002468 [Kwoniella sp. CBS 9459]
MTRAKQTAAERIKARAEAQNLTKDRLLRFKSATVKRSRKSYKKATRVKHKREMNYLNYYLNVNVERGLGDQVIIEDSFKGIELATMKMYTHWRTCLIKHTPFLSSAVDRARSTFAALEDLTGHSYSNGYKQEVFNYIKNEMLKDVELGMVNKKRAQPIASLTDYMTLLCAVWSPVAQFRTPREFHTSTLAIVNGAARPGEFLAGDSEPWETENTTPNPGLDAEESRTLEYGVSDNVIANSKQSTELISFQDLTCSLILESDDESTSRESESEPGPDSHSESTPDGKKAGGGAVSPRLLIEMSHANMKSKIHSLNEKKSAFIEEANDLAGLDVTLHLLALAIEDRVFRDFSTFESIGNVTVAQIQRAGGKFPLVIKEDKKSLTILRETTYENGQWVTHPSKPYLYQSAQQQLSKLMNRLGFEFSYTGWLTRNTTTCQSTYRSKMVSIDLQAMTRGAASRGDRRKYDMGLGRFEEQRQSLTTHELRELQDTAEMIEIRDRIAEVAALKAGDPRAVEMRTLDLKLWRLREKSAKETLKQVQDREYEQFLFGALNPHTGDENGVSSSISAKAKAKAKAVIPQAPSRDEQTSTRFSTTSKTVSSGHYHSPLGHDEFAIDPALVDEPVPTLPSKSSAMIASSSRVTLESLPLDLATGDVDLDIYAESSDNDTDRSDGEDPSNVLDEQMIAEEVAAAREECDSADKAIHLTDAHQTLYDHYQTHCDQVSLPVLYNQHSTQLAAALFPTDSSPATMTRKEMLYAILDAKFFSGRGALEDIPPKVSSDLRCPVIGCGQTLTQHSNEQRKHTHGCLQRRLGEDMWAVWSGTVIALPSCPFLDCSWITEANTPHDWATHFYAHVAQDSKRDDTECSIKMRDGGICGASDFSRGSSERVRHLEAVHGLLALKKPSDKESLRLRQQFCYECCSWILGAGNIRAHAQAHINRDLDTYSNDALSCQSDFLGKRTDETIYKMLCIKCPICLHDEVLMPESRWFCPHFDPNKLALHINTSHIIPLGNNTQACVFSTCEHLEPMKAPALAEHYKSDHLIRLTHNEAQGVHKPLNDISELVGWDKPPRVRKSIKVPAASDENDAVSQATVESSASSSAPAPQATVQSKKKVRLPTQLSSKPAVAGFSSKASRYAQDPLNRMSRVKLEQELASRDMYKSRSLSVAELRAVLTRVQSSEPEIEDMSDAWLKSELKRRRIRIPQNATRLTLIETLRTGLATQQSQTPASVMETPMPTTPTDSLLYSIPHIDDTGAASGSMKGGDEQEAGDD